MEYRSNIHKIDKNKMPQICGKRRKCPIIWGIFYVYQVMFSTINILQKCVYYLHSWRLTAYCVRPVIEGRRDSTHARFFLKSEYKFGIIIKLQERRWWLCIWELLCTFNYVYVGQPTWTKQVFYLNLFPDFNNYCEI